MPQQTSARELDCMFNTIKWFGLQAILYFSTPYLWNYEYGVGAIVLMLIYTVLYVIYGEYTPKENRFRWVLAPYVVYLIIAIVLHIVKSKFSTNNFKKIRIPQFSETRFGSFVGLFSCFYVYKQ